MIHDQMLNECEMLAEKIGAELIKRKATLATAESCTGGWVSMALTSIAGSSDWFDRGFVTYSNVSKQDMLGVLSTTLSLHGAVSAQTAQEMAEGALKQSSVDYSLSVTGIAGPTGGTPQKPVGTVWFAWAGKDMTTYTHKQVFAGNRRDIRLQSVRFALTHLLKCLYDTPFSC